MKTEIDVLLISSPSSSPMSLFSFEVNGMPPLGLGYIATVLKHNNYSVKILDMNMPDKTVKNLLYIMKNNNPKVIGISSTTNTYPNAIRLAEIVKNTNPDSIVVLGGPHVSFEYKSALCSKYVDFVSINEGEISFKKLCDFCIKNLGNLETLKGIAYKQNGDIIVNPAEPFISNLNELPFPDRSVFDDLYKYPVPATISTSRGCPGKCIFCAAGVLSGGKYRLRSAHNIVQEFKYLKSFGYTHVHIIDDTMTANIKRLEEFLDEMILCDLNMTWYCESRVDAMTKEILIKMKKAGLTSIQFGVESGNQKILDSIKKNITLEQIHNVFNWCKDLDILAVTNMIIGQPTDDSNTIQETLNMAKEISSLGALVGFTVCTPYPGTPLWLNPEKYGIEIIDHNLEHYTTFCPVINTKNLTLTEIRNAYYNTENELRKKYPTRNHSNIRMADAF